MTQLGSLLIYSLLLWQLARIHASKQNEALKTIMDRCINYGPYSTTDLTWPSVSGLLDCVESSFNIYNNREGILFVATLGRTMADNFNVEARKTLANCKQQHPAGDPGQAAGKRIRAVLECFITNALQIR